VMPLSRTTVRRLDRGALLLGYAATDEAHMRRGVQRLADALAAVS